MNSLELKILKDARALIAKDGWCKGIAHDGFGRRCMTAALYDAAAMHVEVGSYTHVRNYTSACDKVRATALPGYRCIVEYNDLRSTTLAQVLAAFDKAIESIETVNMYQELESLAQANAEQGEPVREVITLSTSVETVA